MKMSSEHSSLLVSFMVLGLVFLSAGVYAAEDDNVVQRGGMGVILLDLEDLNDSLEDQGYERFDNSLYLSGGGAHEDFTENFRLGGLGYRGSRKTSFQDGNGQLNLTYGGLLLEGKFDLTDKVSLLAGGLLGMGHVNLKINESIPDTFTGALEDTPKTHEMKKSFYGAQPMLVAEVSLFSWLTVRASGGYLWGPAGKWDVAGKKLDGPMDQISAPVFGLSAHLYINESRDDETEET